MELPSKKSIKLKSPISEVIKPIVTLNVSRTGLNILCLIVS